jgi:hypothetical protein
MSVSGMHGTLSLSQSSHDSQQIAPVFHITPARVPTAEFKDALGISKAPLSFFYSSLLAPYRQSKRPKPPFRFPWPSVPSTNAREEQGEKRLVAFLHLIRCESTWPYF